MLEAVCLASSVPLSVALINCVTWRRPGVSKAGTENVSVLIPARNEEMRIEKAIQGALDSVTENGERWVTEVIVYDDESRDQTAKLVLAMGNQDARVRLLTGGPLPPGWIGKPHACQRLFQAAKGDTLVFMDADVELEPLGLSRLLSAHEQGVEVVSAVPRQVTRGPFERAIVSLLLLTYLCWLPLNWVETRKSSRFVAANGQLFSLSRHSLEKLGGFEAVRAAIVDDVALVRHAKQSGQKARFVDGTEIASCRMYESAREVWDGFSKNIAAGLGGSAWAVLAATSLYALCFIAPYAALFYGFVRGDSAAMLLGGFGVLCNVALRTLLCVRYDQPREQIFLHPFSVLVLIAIAWNSWLWVWRRRIAWAGRVYAETQG